MSPGEPRVSVARLREAVREAIEHTSSHAVARDVGMSAPPIRAFVAGSEPRPSTIRKLTAWYVRYRKRTAEGTLDTETAEAAVALLLEHIPASDRDETRFAFYDWLERESARKAGRTPRWVREVKKRNKRKK